MTETHPVFVLAGFAPPPAELEQGGDAWFQARLGKLTASRISDAIARTKTGWGASRANVMADLIAERLTGVQIEGYTNAAMQRGIEVEPQARAAYAFFRDVTVEPVGFIPHPTITMAGASPDGLVGADGLLELKCPNVATHIETLLTQAIPGKYLDQMAWQMACSGRAWVDYASFDPRMPAELSLFVKRVHRDDKRIAELEVLVREFLAELDAKVTALNGLKAA